MVLPAMNVCICSQSVVTLSSSSIRQHARLKLVPERPQQRTFCEEIERVQPVSDSIPVLTQEVLCVSRKSRCKDSSNLPMAFSSVFLRSIAGAPRWYRRQLQPHRQALFFHTQEGIPKQWLLHLRGQVNHLKRDGNRSRSVRHGALPRVPRPIETRFSPPLRGRNIPQNLRTCIRPTCPHLRWLEGHTRFLRFCAEPRTGGPITLAWKLNSIGTKVIGALRKVLRDPRARPSRYLRNFLAN